EKSPAQAEKSPAQAEKSPAQAEKSPAQAEKSPAQAEKSPAQAEKSPAQAEKSPAQAEKSPAQAPAPAQLPKQANSAVSRAAPRLAMALGAAAFLLPPVNSDAYVNTCHNYGISFNNSAAYHTSSNGLVERRTLILKDMVRSGIAGGCG
ncbi:hypothetical protein BKA91DRAFT_147634, partial [Yarrowia lipolytica]